MLDEEINHFVYILVLILLRDYEWCVYYQYHPALKMINLNDDKLSFQNMSVCSVLLSRLKREEKGVCVCVCLLDVDCCELKWISFRFYYDYCEFEKFSSDTEIESNRI